MNLLAESHFLHLEDYVWEILFAALWSMTNSALNLLAEIHFLRLGDFVRGPNSLSGWG